MELKQVKISELKQHPRNPRVHPESALNKLVKSIQTYGWTNPLLVSKDGYILAGHARCKAAEKAGIDEVPAIFLDLEGDKADAYLIADNKLQEETDWDIPLLTDLIRGLGDVGFDISLTGFEAAEIEAFFKDTTPNEVKEDKFDVAKAVEEIQTPISRLGDVWLLGNHRLRCGSSTNESEVQELMNGKKARLVVTDAPYNVNYNNGANANHPSWKKRDGILNDSMSTEQFREFLRNAFTSARNAVEPGSAIFAFMSAQEWPTIDGVLREIGWHWSSSIIWVKDTLVLGRKDFHPRYEAIWYGWPEGTQRLYPLKDDRTQTDVWEFDRPKRSPLHPTQKPLDVIAKPITFCSREGDIVLDLFGGSGSTLIAADQLGRIGYLQELDIKYVDVIIRRFIEHRSSSDDVFLIRDGEKIAWDDITHN